MNRNEVLKQRTITGLIFGLLVLLLLFSGKSTSVIFLLLIAIFGSKEYSAMIYPKDSSKWYILILVIVISFTVTYWIPTDSWYFFVLTILSCLALLAGIVHLWNPFINHSKSIVFTGFLYIVLPLSLMSTYILQLNPYSNILLISIVLLIWANDSFAYLVGSRIGKTKLFETISPKKTWEGFVGGLIFTLLTAGIIFYFTKEHSFSFWFLFAFIIAIIGTLGDLFESSVKRKFHIKDSGNILPGHGGILDRFDSFIYVLPFILFLLLIY